MVATAAVLFAVNGTVSKVLLEAGISSERLTQIRVTGALLALAAVLVAVRPRALRVDVGELPFLAIFGICAVALVQWFYFIAIHRLQIGIALLIQYLAPLLVALWARFVMHEKVRARIWVALGLALLGLSLVVEVWAGGALDGLGVAASLMAAGTFAAYILMAERGVGRRDPISLMWFGFLFAALFWAVIEPWWSFAARVVGDEVSLLGNLAGTRAPIWLLICWMVLLGTVVPFVLIVGALRHIPAARVAIIAMLEPVVATGVAYAWLGETLGAPQLVGGAIVLGGILLAQTAR
ncbi:MAG: EamA family transporter [Actinobacteria bacterium]|nr:EamA family transporter [Actinomycetota bacterium]